ncbi:MAG: hypothetical protein NZL89_04315 [Leptospiraceae bacterium]|nr:hypothetical protein [Leptospiraceae bacterium]
MRLPLWLKDRTRLFYALAAFSHGLILVYFFRVLLNELYPFFRGIASLSQFALLLVALAFAAAALYSPHGTKKPAVQTLRLAMVLAIALVLIAVFRIFGRERVLLLFPLPVTALLATLWYEQARYSFIYQSHKLWLLLGMAFALATSPIAAAGDLFPALPAVAILLSELQQPILPAIAHERIVPLRQSIAILRYAFLALAFHGILGQNRSQLPGVAMVSLGGLIATQLLHFVVTVRPHVLTGLLVLPVLLAFLAGLFNFVSYNLWGAVAYVALLFWESIFFRRTHEAYLPREKILAAATIAWAFFSYYITTDWLQILTGILVIVVLAGILFYVAKNWRKTITALFLLAIASWILSLRWKISQSVTRDFFRMPDTRLFEPQLPATGLVLTILELQKNQEQRIRTNVLPEELMTDPAWRSEKLLPFRSTPATLVLRFAYHCLVRRQPITYILDEKSLGVYAESQAILALQDLFRHTACTLYFTSGEALRPLQRPAEQIFPDPQKLRTLTKEDAAKLLALARAIKRRDQLAEAQQIYDQIFRFFQDDPMFLRELASLAAARGDLEQQIRLLNLVIALRKDNTLYDKKLLMELYALSNERKKSAALAYEILAEGQESPLAIFAFLQRLFSEPFDRYEMQALYQRVLNYQPRTELEIIKYTGLRRTIEQSLQQNPTYDRQFTDEKYRQEFISFPE